MKTTLEISNSLLREARKLAAQERTTLRALVEQGLQRVLTERKRTGCFSAARSRAFGGEGCDLRLPGLSAGSGALA